MTDFNIRLKEYIEASSGISNIVVYVESFPAPENTTTNIIGIIPSGERINPRGFDQEMYTRRFIVTGTAKGAKDKAWELMDFFVPKRTTKPGWNVSTGFAANEYQVKKVFQEKLPSLVQNNGNIFYADFVLRFMTVS